MRVRAKLKEESPPRLEGTKRHEEEDVGEAGDEVMEAEERRT
ncbi:MAG: hypothetical protein V2A58_17040 [Planctomycetota bacterium]